VTEPNDEGATAGKQPTNDELLAGAEELRSLGWDIADIVNIYGPVVARQLSESLTQAQRQEEAGLAKPPADDATEPLKAAKSDPVTRLQQADDIDDLDRRSRESRIKSDDQDIKLRKRLARWTVRAASVMLGASTAVFILYMISEWGEVPAEAIIAWLTSTVLQVLGIVYVIASYLFPRPTDGGTDK
jgi:hypothetical protein